jgi:creatinine amidohydrolase
MFDRIRSILKTVIAIAFFTPHSGYSQVLHSRWDELTASEWSKALQKSDSTCILPIGILEKHGPHAPIGSDLIHVREWAARATKQENNVTLGIAWIRN